MSAPRRNGQPDDLGIHIAKDVQLEEIEAIDIDGLIFYKQYPNVIVGTPGMGKSTLMATIVAAITSAGKSVVYSSTEDAISVTRARIESAGGDLTLAAIIDPDYAPNLPEDEDRLDRMCEKMHGKAPLGAIILDPFTDHLPSSEHKMREGVRPLMSLARKYNVPVILAGHTLKTVKENADPLTAIPGKVLAQRARRAYVFGVHPGDAAERAMVCIKDQFRDEKGRGYAFTMDEDLVEDDNGTIVTVGQLTLYDSGAKIFWHDTLRPPEDGDRKKKGRTAELLSVATEWVEDVLTPSLDNPTGRMKSAEFEALAEQDGISKSTRRRAEKSLQEKGFLEKVPEGGGKSRVWFTQLTATHPAVVAFVDAAAAQLSNDLDKGV